MMVSLPSTWVKDQRLKKGDEIDISEADNALKITSKKGELALKKEVKIHSLQEYKNRLIDVPYMQGYDEIIVHFEDAAVMEKIIKDAARKKVLVTIDMEEHDYTDLTLSLYKKLRKNYDNVWGVLQSRLFRTEKDIDNLVGFNAHIRLCIGIYLEPADISLQKKAGDEGQIAGLC